MITTVSHQEIATTTAGRLGKNYDSTSVDKVVKEYTSVVAELARDKRPESVKDETLIETPLIGLRIKCKENGIRKNADGSETKLGKNWTINTAVPNKLLEILNTGVVEEATKAAGKLIRDIGKIKAAA